MNIGQLVCWLIALVLAALATFGPAQIPARWNLYAAALFFFILGFVLPLFVH